MEKWQLSIQKEANMEEYLQGILGCWGKYCKRALVAKYYIKVRRKKKSLGCMQVSSEEKCYQILEKGLLILFYWD